MYTGMDPYATDYEDRESPAHSTSCKQPSKVRADSKQQAEHETMDVILSTYTYPTVDDEDWSGDDNARVEPPTGPLTNFHENNTLELHRTDQSGDNRLVFLPRLAGSSFRMCQDTKQVSRNGNQDNHDHDDHAYFTGTGNPNNKHLTGNGSPENIGNGSQLRLPDIHVVCNRTSRLALNRSITDLLDPEMEILNKIKYGPRKKKKKKHRIQTVQNDSLIDDVF